ncbi:hypothetical protein B0H67DRAFT_561272 [Lasiosphaeris hirsuta]|uniref:Uncharacterized protein n=1 Tax=Lasiosphaeris hirsuta TaxID=260670 RepID=A0AA40BAA0_9PEZI|nr:hypothetical protein B0H67DRAFT_561272 [Lasiosphaeris hirsuta]
MQRLAVPESPQSSQDNKPSYHHQNGKKVAYGGPWYWHTVWHSQPCPSGCKNDCRKGYGREDPVTCPRLPCGPRRGRHLMKANPLARSRPSWAQRLCPSKREPYPFITNELGPFVGEIAKTVVRQHQELAGLRHRPRRPLLSRILASLSGSEVDAHCPLQHRMPALWPSSDGDICGAPHHRMPASWPGSRPASAYDSDFDLELGLDPQRRTKMLCHIKQPFPCPSPGPQLPPTPPLTPTGVVCLRGPEKCNDHLNNQVKMRRTKYLSRVLFNFLWGMVGDTGMARVGDI